jgi:cysteine synthase B
MINSMKTLESYVGNTPLVKLRNLVKGSSNTVLAKLEGNNPAGSVKDRPALNMIKAAEERGEISPGTTLIEATSGNTGIALAMAAAIRGYPMVLIMPEHLSEERRVTMRAFGATILSVTREEGMEGARDLAIEMEKAGKGVQLDQFSNADNPDAHYKTTGPEIWSQTEGRITHFVSAMGTTGTIMGVSRYLKEKNPQIRIIGVQPEEGATIAGIRRWPMEYLPSIYEPSRVDRVIDVGQDEAEAMAIKMAKEEGIFCGISSGGAMAAVKKLDNDIEAGVIVTIVCDRGDRYLSTGVFP